tara:strand:+ start:3657 stop:3845 length:189 start_codon:yes stop_codon:yes gene_type:complete
MVKKRQKMVKKRQKVTKNGKNLKKEFLKITLQPLQICLLKLFLYSIIYLHANELYGTNEPHQ